MPLRLDEVKEVQEIAMIAAKTSAMLTYSQIIEKMKALEKRLSEIEKQQYVAPTKQGKKEN